MGLNISDMFENFDSELMLVECKVYISTFDWWEKLVAVCAPRPVKLHFMIDDKEAPDEMTLGFWRSIKGANIILDHSEGGGGIKSTPHVPELM